MKRILLGIVMMLGTGIVTAQPSIDDIILTPRATVSIQNPIAGAFSVLEDSLYVLTGDGVVWKIPLSDSANATEVVSLGSSAKRGAFSPDLSAVALLNDEAVTIWDIQTGELRWHMLFLEDNVNNLRYHPSASLLMVSTRTGELRGFDSLLGNQIMQWYSFMQDSSALTFSDDGRWFAIGSWDDLITVYEEDSEYPLTYLRETILTRRLRGHGMDVTALRFTADNAGLWAGGNERVVLWDIPSGTIRGQMAVDEWAWDIAVFRYWVVVATSRGTLWVFDDDRFFLLTRIEAHDGLILQMLVHPDGVMMATLGIDHQVRLWDIGDV